MPNYCHITVVGHVTRDPEVRYTSDNKPIASCAVAINTGWGDKKKVMFLDFKLFGKRAENLGKMVTKGQALLVAGRLEQESWTDKRTGEMKSKMVVIAEDWQFMGGGGPKKDAENEGASLFEGQPPAATDDETPF